MELRTSRFSSGTVGTSIKDPYDAGMDGTDAGAAARSYLYVPGDQRDKLDGGLARGADAVIADLEDAVPAAAKADARATVATWLAGLATPRCRLWVRVNADTLAGDISSVVCPGLDGVVVPKAEPGLLAEVDQLLTERESRGGLPVGGTRVIGLIETAVGLIDATAVAGAPRVAHLGIGEADLAAELRLRPTGGREELTSLRLQVVVASAAAGIGPPLGPTSTDFHDLDRVRRSAEQLLRLGFRARTAIHPAQVAVINEVFTPTAREVADARELVERFEGTGAGVVTDSGGRMIDLAIVRAARETLARARHAEMADGGG